MNILVFPLDKQVGKVRHVAAHLLTKRTERSASYYRGQITDAIVNRLQRARVPENGWDEQIGAFWQAVECEMLRQVYSGTKSGGAA